MSGYMMIMAECLGCGRTFMANPNRVPSIRVNGVRQPICRNCFERRQTYREQHGLEREPLHPDAYEPEVCV